MLGKTFRTPTTRRPIIPYVCPDGRIVDAQWAIAVNNRVLKSDDKEGDRDGRMVHVHTHLAEQGYVLLRDLYRRENFAAGFVQYMDWANAVYYGGHSKAFPEELLPREVLRRREQAVETETWTPSIEVRDREGAS